MTHCLNYLISICFNNHIFNNNELIEIAYTVFGGILYRKVKGFRDIFGEDILYWHKVEENFNKLFNAFGYDEFKIPILEKTELFNRGIGKTTDIVEKEMFSFQDLGKEHLSLRPEGTAALVRGYLENKLYNPPGIKKFYYYGPMFRRERPQKGRFRQFYQVGVEVFGSDAPSTDADVIAVLYRFFELCGIREDLRLEINSIGCPECRTPYREKLIEFMDSYTSDLCGDCQRRLHTNPLRILDCKVERCKEIAKDAPLILDHLCSGCSDHFSETKKYLEIMGIEYHINPKMVRGLDYYVRTAFEMVTDKLGASSAVGAGGRYDGLVQLMGGSDIPGIGFAIGVDRLVSLMMEKEKIECNSADIFIVSFKDISDKIAIELVNKFRMKGFRAEFDYDFASMKSQMKKANKAGASFTVIIGEDEVNAGNVSVKNMETGVQSTIKIEDLMESMISTLTSGG